MRAGGVMVVELAGDRLVQRLEVLDIEEVTARLAGRPPGEYLIDPLWPSDAYGVIGAPDKAGKTWAVLDLAVSVVTSTPWLGRFPVIAGPAIAFLGEGGERATIRRLTAIVENRGGDLGDLGGLRLCFAVPHLLDPADLAQVADELDRQPRLVLLDPLYLAARGTKGSDLYAMGEALEGIQRLVQSAGAALVVSTHWNKTGEGSGPERFTGVGPGAWGRVLGSAAIEQRHTVRGVSTVTLRWQFSGSEIGDTSFLTRRRVWVDDPADLSSAMHYEVEEADAFAEPEAEGLTPSQRRVLLVHRARPGVRLTVTEIGNEIATDGQGRPLRRRTIQQALTNLAERGLVEGEAEGPGLPRRWWAT